MRVAAAGAATRLATLAAGAFAMAWAAIACLAAVGGGSTAQLPSAEQTMADAPVADIPSDYLELYRAAGARYGIDWAVLAGIGKVECDHGRDPDPSCRREGAVNQAGAGGPMQFLAATWAVYGVDGDDDGRRDRWDAADAIYSAANYLHAVGAPASYSRAIFAYNHSASYVRSVLSWATRYRKAASSARPEVTEEDGWAQTVRDRTSTPVELIEGSIARLARGDGHVALIPTRVPASVQAMLIGGNELQSLPYGPDGHPDPRGAPDEDCSSTVNYVLSRAGLRPIDEIVRDNPLAQDYVGWGVPGPGRWVTIYATDIPTPHVFLVIAGLRLDTSHAGTDVGPNRNQDGPRWRIFDGIPTWAHWSVRHPPGL